jgi:conserved oligomeric Golgi complex subunit 7
MDDAASDELDAFDRLPDVLSWLNHALDRDPDADADDRSGDKQSASLAWLDHRLLQLISAVDVAQQDTSAQLERLLDDVSRTIPRISYDLHFMNDAALSLNDTLRHLQSTTRDLVPPPTASVLDQLSQLHTIKTRMEAARDVLREAESWSSLEVEVMTFIADKNYAGAASRLNDASRSMVVFQNTPEYDPRRALMVNLQNQLEASLSSALVSAINVQDNSSCKNYFSIFSNIQREPEFRNYYYGSRRASLVQSWQSAHLVDCEPVDDKSALTFAEYLPKFYSAFLNLLNSEKSSIPAIFPDPQMSFSSLIMAVLSALQPTISQRLSAVLSYHGNSALKELISLFHATEEFGVAVQKLVEKIQLSVLPSSTTLDTNDSQTPPSPSASRRRSLRMSMSWRSSGQKSSSLTLNKSGTLELGWDQELFQPFLDFQLDYANLEQRMLEHSLQDMMASVDSRQKTSHLDQARLLKERAVDVFGVAAESWNRCMILTYGYGSVGLASALDAFFKSFIDLWITELDTELLVGKAGKSSTGDLTDIDYTAQDWSSLQHVLHFLSSARDISERIYLFETKLRSDLSITAAKFRLAQTDPVNFAIAPVRGAGRILEQSTLNSAELHALLGRADLERDGIRQNTASHPSSQLDTLLPDARAAIFTFAAACQASLQRSILAPLQAQLAAYSSSPLWSASDDKRSRHNHDLQVPSFSLSPSDTIQKIAEGLLNLPMLFDVYADDDALSFSLHTLPHLDEQVLKVLSSHNPSLSESSVPSHNRRQSLSSVKSLSIDQEFISSAWLSSLGHSLALYLTSDVLPKIASLTDAGAAQLSSDLSHLSTIFRALNVESAELELWKDYVGLENEGGVTRLSDAATPDATLQNVARMRGWRR